MIQKPESITALEKELNLKFDEHPLGKFWGLCWDRRDSNDAWASFALNPTTQQVLGLGFGKVPIKTAILKQFKHLQILWAKGCDLQQIADLKHLTQITHLRLDNNKIKDLAPLAQLTSLTWLDLDGNQIQELAPLAQLTSLTTLSLVSNQIQELAPLAQLTSLTHLWLNSNQIQELAPLAQLTSLTVLYLSSNQIQDLTPLASLFRSNCKIDFDKNPLVRPPLEISMRGNEAILAWFAAQAEEQRPLIEAKVLLVGAGGAGKTSLVKALLNRGFDAHESQTHGIKVERWPLACDARKVLVHLWDFGGQEMMHATHQFFLSRRSLYLLLLDGRREEHLEEYWLKMIESFGGDSPILVVLSKSDDNPGFDLNRRALQEKYPGIVGFYRVSSKTKNGLPALVEALAKTLAQLTSAESTWPHSWFRVKQTLESMAENYVDYARYQAICADCKVTELVQQRTLLDYLHDLGICLHFSDLEWLDTQVLKPNWVTAPVYALINHPSLAQSHGLLQINELAKLLPDFPRGNHRYLEQLMARFEICFPIGHNQLLFPDLLPVSQPDLPGLGAHPLTLRIVYDFLPRSILVRLMVQLHRFIKDRLQWRTGMVLEHKELKSQAIIRVDYEQRGLTLEAAGSDRKKFLNIILGHLREIQQSFQIIGCRELVPCRCTECLESEKPFEYEYNQLIQLQERAKTKIVCHKSGDDVSVNDLLGETYLAPLADLTEYQAELEEYRRSFSKREAFVGFALKWVSKNHGDRPTTSGNLEILIETIWKRGLAPNPNSHSILGPSDATTDIGEAASPKEAEAANQLCWLHLSDLHHNPKNAWDSTRILRLLREDAASVFKEQQLRPQLLFATGDLGYGEGSSKLSLVEQIKATLKYLDEVAAEFGIPSENIFMVPGNHDVNRGKILGSHKSYCKELIGDPKAQQAIAQMMDQNDEEWCGLQRRVQDYLEAVSSHHKHLYRDHAGQAVYHQIRNFEGVAVGIFGFNGVWSCGSEDKPGNLLLGAQWQLNLAEKLLAQTQLNFGLIHHPPNWYTKSEQDLFKSRLDHTFNFLLHGHEHEDWVHATGQAKEGGCTLLRVAAGASYATNAQELGYNIGSLNLKTGEGQIHLRTYSDENWIPKIIKNRANTGAWPFQIQLKPTKP